MLCGLIIQFRYREKHLLFLLTRKKSSEKVKFSGFRMDPLNELRPRSRPLLPWEYLILRSSLSRNYRSSFDDEKKKILLFVKFSENLHILLLLFFFFLLLSMSGKQKKKWGRGGGEGDNEKNLSDLH